MNLYLYTCLLSVMLFFSSCSTNQQNLHKELSRNSEQTTQYQGHYKIGKPYQIKSVRYEPYTKVSTDHAEIGKASWYGNKEHGRKTANGDKFNRYMLTAAHKKMPIPCMARVTNLKNQKQVIVMINDRGPFEGNRIVDVSEAAAERLGFKHHGITNVKLEYMHEETTKLLAKLGLEEKNGSKSTRRTDLAQGCSTKCYIELMNAKHNLIELSAHQKKLYAESIKQNDV